MTQEQKDILLKDLCARLPYNVKIKIKTYEDIDEIDSIGTLCQLNKQYFWILEDEYERCVEYNKPYLFPLSSMTDEQIMQSPNSVHVGDLEDLRYDSESTELNRHFTDLIDLIDWFNKNHFDYRGLIEKGLAIDATGLNIY